MNWTSPRQITRTKPEKMIREVKKCMSYPQSGIRVDRATCRDSAVRPADIAGASRAIALPCVTTMAAGPATIRRSHRLKRRAIPMRSFFRCASPCCAKAVATVRTSPIIMKWQQPSHHPLKWGDGWGSVIEKVDVHPDSPISLSKGASSAEECQRLTKAMALLRASDRTQCRAPDTAAFLCVS
jgi:hypothetical protein